MTRQNLFSDAWDGDNEQEGTRHRIFWRPDDARMGATLYELAPGAPGTWMHMHFGAEEVFFVLSGRPVFRNHHGEEELAPGDFVSCPEGRAGLHAFRNPSEEHAQILAISAGSFPDVVAYPNTDMHGWQPVIPIPSCSRKEATPASSRASRSRSSRSFGRLPAVARHEKRPWGRPLLVRPCGPSSTERAGYDQCRDAHIHETTAAAQGRGHAHRCRAAPVVEGLEDA